MAESGAVAATLKAIGGFARRASGEALEATRHGRWLDSSVAREPYPILCG
jgi:hypothetical protein